jgi:hypothetical protein
MGPCAGAVEDAASASTTTSPNNIGDSTHGGGSIHGGGNTHGGGGYLKQESAVGHHDDLQRELGKRKTRAVLCLRLLFIVSLLGASLAVSLSVYFISSTAEHNNFATHWDGSSARMLQAFQDIAAKKLAAVGGLEVAFTAESLYHNEPWPFVTLPAFQERAATVRSLSGSLFLSISPIVANGTMREEWEAYAAGNKSSWM